MKYHHQLGFLADWITPSEAEELTRINPETRIHNGFGYKLTTNNPNGDAFIRRALDILRSHNIPRRRSANSTSYGYTVSRLYEHDDLRKSEFLLLTRQRRIHDCFNPARDENGRLFLLASKAKASLKLGSLWWPDSVIVSQPVRHSLEDAGIIGLRFNEVNIKGKSSQLSPEPFWELLSLSTMPKLVNRGNLIHPVLYPDHPTVEPFRGDYTRIVAINDEPFSKGELHYHRSDLEALGSFDIATTFENYMRPHPSLVISQRFYQHCLKHKIPLEVEPVRIDPD